MSAAPADPGVRAEPPRRRGSLRRDVVVTTGTDLAVSLVGMAASLVSARLLLAEGRGVLAAIVTLPTLLGTLASLGMPDALVYFGARQRQDVGRQLGTAMTLTLGGSVVFAAVGYLLVPLVLNSQSAATIEATRWYLLSIPVVAVGTSIVAQPLRGVGDYVWWNAIRAAPFVAWLLVLLAAALVREDDPGTIALWFLLARLVLVPPSIVAVRLRLRQTIRPARRLVEPLLRYGLPLTVSTVPRVVNLRLDQLMIPAFLDAKELGLYVVGIGWSSIVLPFQRGLASVFFPKVAADEGEVAAQAFGQGSRIGLLTTAALVVVVLPLTPIVLPILFGSEFDEAVPVACLLVVSALPNGWNWVLAGGLRGLGASKAVMWSELAGMVITLVALPVGLVVAGIVGAAVASIVGYGTVSVIMVVLSRRLTGLGWREIAVPGAADVALIWGQVRRRA